jgi:hypothetical protein
MDFGKIGKGLVPFAKGVIGGAFLGLLAGLMLTACIYGPKEPDE